MTTSVFYTHPKHLLQRTTLLTCRNIGVIYSPKPETKTFGGIHKLCVYWLNLNITEVDTKVLTWSALVIFGLTLASNSPSIPHDHTNQWNFGFLVTA